MIGKNTGVQNEIDFASTLNNKHYFELGPNASEFIAQLYPLVQQDTIIKAEKVGGQGLKPDVQISVVNDYMNISIKKGNGNSVHQEKLALFLLYCKDNLGMTDYTRNCFLSFIYGDGTLDGKGQIEDRKDGSDLCELYSEEIKTIQEFLNKNSRPLIERFLVYGRLGKELNIKADYLYHGEISDGVWCPLDETVDYLVEKASNEEFQNTPCIGPLTLQSWNRNLSGKPEFEKRRDSIQIKWGGKIKEYISKINQIYLSKINSNSSYNSRIFGDNSHGFENANQIAAGLNGCRVRNLRGSLLGLINTIFPGVALTDTIQSAIINGKPDINIHIGARSYNVSIFIGNGNSVHQENFLGFLEYCNRELRISEIEENALRLIYYGDKTLDGSGELNNRINNSHTIKKEYPKETKIAQAFFDRNRRALAKRFLVTGKYYDKPSSDYIFHGNINTGVSMSLDNVLDYIENFEGKRNGLLSIGPLSFQMWNRNISGDINKEFKRESLQIKWPSMKACLYEALSLLKEKQVRRKIKGISAEYELVHLLNQNRTESNPLWKKLKAELNFADDNVFAIRVSKQVHSQFLGKTIYPKSDLYLCKSNISNVKLRDIDYYLDESVADYNGFEITPIPNSGISCKIPSSRNFTYAKIGVDSFMKIFGNKILGAGASVFVKEVDLKNNINVITGWGVSEQDFLTFINTDIGLANYSNVSNLNLGEWTKVKSFCTNKIESIIQSNIEIQNKIFTGKGIFEDPYYSPFIFSHGELKRNYAPNDFLVTTGSGRHKGIYTIIIKPSTKQIDSVAYNLDRDIPLVAEP